jgi:hypothetical protein
MPGFITHYICAQAVLTEISQAARESISKYPNMYNLGAQGPDIFFYYFPGLIKKRTKGIGVRMHMENPGAFIVNLSDAANRAAEADKPLILAYTAGYLTHYALDAATHPFVYARSGLTKDERKRREMHASVRHRQLETTIDVKMLKLLSGKKPADYKLWQLINADAGHMLTAAEAISCAINKTYKHKLNSADVYKAMRYMVNLTRLLQSKTGRRKRLMELAEDFTIRARYVSSIIHQQEADDGKDHMNISKKNWRTPWDAYSSSNSSFIELYNEAVVNGRQMVDALFAFTRKHLPITEYRKSIGNRSLKTGQTWEQSL